MAEADIAVDHLLLGVNNLNRGIRWIEQRTGIPALPGGSHPGAGTRNALLSLSDRRYLEIVAPDPAQTAYSFPVDVRRLEEPRLVTWAVALSDLDELLGLAAEIGYATSGPQPGARTRPDGRVLSWDLVRLQNPFARDGIEPFPFFIQWAKDSVHPSVDSPPGCELVSLEFEHPDAPDFAEALRRFGIVAPARQAVQAAIVARLRTPRGEVELR